MRAACVRACARLNIFIKIVIGIATSLERFPYSKTPFLRARNLHFSVRSSLDSLTRPFVRSYHFSYSSLEIIALC